MATIIFMFTNISGVFLGCFCLKTFFHHEFPRNVCWQGAGREKFSRVRGACSTFLTSNIYGRQWFWNCLSVWISIHKEILCIFSNAVWVFANWQISVYNRPYRYWRLTQWPCFSCQVFTCILCTLGQKWINGKARLLQNVLCTKLISAKAKFYSLVHT